MTGGEEDPVMKDFECHGLSDFCALTISPDNSHGDFLNSLFYASECSNSKFMDALQPPEMLS